ncbi:uncharacterized protein [Chironomus tepperi]|uniref:uncharacterized protein n=1 Tax=Chironomus tepperi TaxID=113505 RepID=UPI00391FC676
MRIPTVENFLFCIRLELGALIIGWFKLLESTVFLLGLSTMLVWAIFAYAHMVSMLPADSYFSDLMNGYSPILVKFVILIAIVYFGIVFYAAKRLVDSLKSRTPHDTVPFMILVVFDFVFSLLSVLHFTWIALIQALIRAIFYGYVFICIFSFKQQLTEEARKSHHRISQYQSAPLTSYKL